MTRWISALACWLCLMAPVQATLTIEITEGVEDAEPIAVVPFGWQGQDAPAVDIAAIVSADLRRSGRFRPMAEKDMLAKPTQTAQIRFKNWRIMDVPYLVIGQMREVGENSYQVEFRLFDVFRAKQLTGYRMPPVRRNQLRMIAHQISDAVYQEITGERGAFATRLAYIKKLPKQAEDPYRYLLFIADADTENERPILRSRNPIFSPTWSPDGSKLAYAVARSTGQSIYVFNLASKRIVQLTRPAEKFSAPAWSPDGRKMAMAKLENGSSDIFVMDLDSMQKRRITRHWAIDTEPTWSPDGKSLVFTSDRGGSPQLYQYDFDTGKVKRLTFEGKQNLRASFSPDGRMICFVRMGEDGQHMIAVMDLENETTQVLSKRSQQESWHESPTFAPNGSMIMYAAIWRGRNVLAAISVDGRVHQRFSVKTGANVQEPAWSPFLD